MGMHGRIPMIMRARVQAHARICIRTSRRMHGYAFARASARMCPGCLNTESGCMRAGFSSCAARACAGPPCACKRAC
eukprot:352063-Chlamydomonas_euryale.AAC.2